MRLALLFTVEHGDNKVPPEYAHLFIGQESVLASHRGHDPGAGELAIRFATRFHAPCERAEITRLLVDQNRSVHNRRTLFSAFTRPLPLVQKDAILSTFYWPYQHAVRDRVADLLQDSDAVLHLAIHSFTPELHGRVRNCEIGLMYDPKRPLEKEFSCRWQAEIKSLDPGLRVRRNYPYQGDSDGIVRSMRRQWPTESYIGLQIEVNQKFPFGDRDLWKRVQKVIIESFERVLPAG